MTLQWILWVYLGVITEFTGEKKNTSINLQIRNLKTVEFLLNTNIPIKGFHTKNFIRLSPEMIYVWWWGYSLHAGFLHFRK